MVSKADLVGFEKAFFENASGIICVAWKDDQVKIVNPAFEKILGYNNEEILSTPFLDLVHPEDKERTSSEYSKVMKGEDHRNVSRFRLRDQRCGKGRDMSEVHNVRHQLFEQTPEFRTDSVILIRLLKRLTVSEGIVDRPYIESIVC